MFWFQKHHPDVVYMDIRQEHGDIHGKHVHVDPDVIGDFRNIPYDDGRFDMVVFDPPHLRWVGPNSIMKAQYGQLSDTWQQDIAHILSGRSVPPYLPSGIAVGNVL